MLNIFKRRPPRVTLEEYEAKLAERGLNLEDGSIELDPTPMAPPVGYKKQPTMVELIRDMVRNEKISQELAAAGAETFEEADDFDIGDDATELTSGYENDFDPPASEINRAVAAARQESGGAGAPPAPSPAASAAPAAPAAATPVPPSPPPSQV